MSPPTKGIEILRTHARQRVSALSGWITMLICSVPVPCGQWHNRSSKMSASGGKWRHCLCRIHNQHNVSLKCFIWIVAWFSLAALTHASSLSKAETLSEANSSILSTLSTLSKATPHNAASATVPQSALPSSGKICTIKQSHDWKSGTHYGRQLSSLCTV